MPYDESLEEIWRIKREIAAEYPTLEAYFKGMLEYQEELKRQGVKFVRLPPRAGAPYPAVSVPATPSRAAFVVSSLRSALFA